MWKIGREFTEAWPLIVAAFLAGFYTGWARAAAYHRKRQRERNAMVKGGMQ